MAFHMRAFSRQFVSSVPNWKMKGHVHLMMTVACSEKASANDGELFSHQFYYWNKLNSNVTAICGLVAWISGDILADMFADVLPMMKTQGGSNGKSVVTPFAPQIGNSRSVRRRLLI